MSCGSLDGDALIGAELLLLLLTPFGTQWIMGIAYRGLVAHVSHEHNL